MTRFSRAIDVDHVLAEYPRPQLVRADWLNLNGLWQFKDAQQNEAPPFGVQLSESILVPFPVESALSGIARRVERMWYRRELEVPAGWRDRRVLLHFGAVDWECRVFVNEKRVSVHRGGYDPFTIDITDALKAGARQELVVGVFDPTDAGAQPRGKQVRKPEGIWYTPSSGIWQTVWLEPVPMTRIRGLELVPDLDRGELKISIVRTDEDRDTDQLEAVAFDHGREVARVTGTAGGWSGRALTLSLPNAHSWSPADPFLYDLELRLLRDGEAIDRADSYFGMRKIAVQKDERGVPRLYLNNRPLFEMGVLDQGFWPDGLYTAPSDEALRSDVELVKQLGFNLIRKHVKVEPERWYQWCDRLGVLVWQDMPSGGSRTVEEKEQFKLELVRLLQLHGNHPSIVTWVVFNEGWGQFDTPELVEAVQHDDPSRLVSNASGWTDAKCGDVMDIHVYPGPNAPAVEHERAGVLGEFGGLGLGVEHHTWEKKSWGYRGVGDSDELTDGYVNLMRRVLELRDTAGLSAAVYTQLTDVESECNGLVTYDREVVKVDVDRVAAANLGSVPRLDVVLPDSRTSDARWRYRFDAPASDWTAAELDDGSWSEGPGGFGTAGTPGAFVKTTWDTGDIWLRRAIVLDPGPNESGQNESGLGGHLEFLVHHDEDVEIYVNGVLAAKAGGYTTGYEPLAMTKGGRAAFVRGRNLIAVHCRQTAGGQYIDLGLVRAGK